MNYLSWILVIVVLGVVQYSDSDDSGLKKLSKFFYEFGRRSAPISTISSPLEDEEEEEDANKSMNHDDTIKGALQPCDEDKLMNYLAQMQAINPESVVNLAAAEEVDTLCKRVTLGLYNLNMYLQTCEPPHEKDLYMQLIQGVKALHTIVCLDDEFKASFTKYFGCYHQLHDEYEDCTGPADWAESVNSQTVCSAYNDIAACYFIKTTKLCGKEGAQVMQKLLKNVINSVITVKCKNILKEPNMSGADTHGNINTEKSLWLVSLSFNLLCLCLVRYYPEDNCRLIIILSILFCLFL